MTRRTFILCAIVAVLSVTSTAAATRALITSEDIKNGTIQVADLSPAAKRALRGQRGPQGKRGPAGFTSVYTSTGIISLDPHSGGAATAMCETGGERVGGGFESFWPNPDVVVTKSWPRTATSWEVRADNTGDFHQLLIAYVICADVG